MASLNDIRDVIRGAIASLFGFGGRLIARAALMIIAGRAFGMEALGVLGQVAAISEIAAAIGVMGLKRGLLDILSFEEKQGRTVASKVMEALGASLFISFAISFICLGIWYLILPGQSNLLLIFFFIIPLLVFINVALAAIKFKRIIGWDVWSRAVAEPWVFLALAILFFKFGMMENGLLIAYFCSISTAAFVTAIGLVRTYGANTLLHSQPQIKNWMPLLKKSAPVAFTDIGFMALRRIDLIVLSLIVSPERVGLYYMVQQIATVPQKTYALFEPMLSPVIAKLHHNFEAKKIRSNLIGICRWVFIIQVSVSIPTTVYSDTILSVFGPDFAIGASILAIILLAELIDGSFMATETALVFAKPKIPPTLFFMTIIIEVAVIALLANFAGVTGAAIGFLITVSFLAISRIVMTKKHLNISILNRNYIKPILIAILITAILWSFRKFTNIQNGYLISINIAATIALYLYLVKRTALTYEDQVLFRALGQKRLKRKKAKALARASKKTS